MIEGFSCNREIKPIADWVKEESPERCPPCLVKPLASNYLGALQDAKADSQIAMLNKAWETANVLTIAEALDTIKSEVGDNLKQELLELDCFAQSYEPLTAEEQLTQEI